MPVSRRNLLATAATAAILPTMGSAAGEKSTKTWHHGDAANVGARSDPWLELSPSAFAHNAAIISQKANGRPIWAVAKCNGYGLDHKVVGPLVDSLPQVAGIAVVTAEEAIETRDAGVTKPILLMDEHVDWAGEELARRDITFSVYAKDAKKRLMALAKKTGRKIRIQPYIDTGFHRLGMKHEEALPWLEDLAGADELDITGMFTEFSETRGYDIEQLAKFNELVTHAQARGMELGDLHASASNAIVHLPEASLDVVRPGNMLYGIFPDDTPYDYAPLRVAYHLKARVIRVMQVPAGDAVGYGRPFIAEKPTHVAVIKCGHSDGYVYRKGGNGTHVLINENLYPMIGLVSASHTTVDLGAAAPTVSIGDVATLLGPEGGVRPYELADTLGIGRYEQFRLNARLPKYIGA